MSNLPRAGRILRRMLPAMILIAAAGATCSAARAEYPERQITMIVCFPAGGGTDIAARLINTPLGEALGKPVIIENRGGAGGNIGIAAAALAGQVDLYTANIGSLMALIDAGKVRPIAVTSRERWPDLPNVPSLEELGVKDAVSDTFQGIYAPAATPQPVINRLAKELALILNRPDIREKFVKAGLPVVAEGPEVFRARIAREVPMYKDIIDKAGLKIQ